ncbi:MAG: FAD-dependent oxidoreductase [Pseudomonadota bacterium]
MRDDAKSLWKDTATDAFFGQSVVDDAACSVAVIGGGFTGLRAALSLAEAGVDVCVFEAQEIGFGASGRNGGQVNPMLPVKLPADLRAAVGDTYFDRLAEVSLGSADELFALIKRYNIDCDARQNGWLRADHCEQARREARSAATEWNRFGAGFEFVDGDDVKSLTGSPSYSSAVLSPRGGAVQPLSLVRGLARAAHSAGAKIYTNARVSGMKRKNGRWQIAVNERSVQSDIVIAATNGYTDGLVPGLARSVLPLTPVQIATGPLNSNQIGPLLPQGHTISDTRRLIMYSRREPGDQFVFGGIGYRLATGGIGGFKWLLRDAERTFPSLKGVNWQYRWGGQIALTSDHVPHLHEPEPGLLAGLGYNGRGVAMSMIMGRVLAERALGAASESLPFPVSPIRSQAFRNTQVFGAIVAMHGMRLLDLHESKRG